MIVSCPSCGTSYKRPPATTRARARCGCCATTIDLSGLRPYRIVRAEEPGAEDLARAGGHLPIGLDEPTLATRIAGTVGSAKPAPLVPLMSSAEVWDETESLPEIPEMAVADASAFERPVDDAGEALRAIAESEGPGGSAFTVYGFWAVGGAIVGTGTSWTLGGTTAVGLVAGGLCGVAAAWGWLRWTPRP